MKRSKKVRLNRSIGGNISINLMLILFGAFVVFSFLVVDEKKLDEETIGLRNFLLMAFTLQIFAPLHTLAMRMGY